MSGFLSRRGLTLLIGMVLMGMVGAGTLRRASGEPETKIEYWVVELDVSKAARPGRAVQEKLATLGDSGWELIELREPSGQAQVFWLVMSREKR